MNEFSRVDTRLTFDFVGLNPEDDGGNGGGGGGPASASTAFGADSKNDFKESEHPRDKGGKFTAGAGGGAGGNAGNATTEASAPQHSTKAKADINKSKELGVQAQHTAGQSVTAVQSTTPRREEYPPIKPLSRDPAVYQKLVEQFPHSKDMTYNRDSMILVQGVRDTILEVAEETNLPPEAIAACMLDENTSIKNRMAGIKDNIQDFFASFSWTRMKLHEIRSYIAENPTEATRARGGILHPPMWDIGPYNLNIAYCYELFEKDVLSATTQNPLKSYILQGTSANASDEEKWDFYLDNCLLDPKGGVYVVAAALQDGQAKLGKYMQNSTPEVQAALLVSSYKLGFAKMESKYKERTKNEATPPDMLPGEGARMFYNIDKIWRVLYGQDIPQYKRSIR